MSDRQVQRTDLEEARRRVHVVLDEHERRDLQGSLGYDEVVLHMARSHEGGRSGVLVLTDRRLLSVVDTRFEHHASGWPFEALTAVHWARGVHHGTLHLFTGDHMDLVHGLELHAARPLVEALRERVTVQTVTPAQAAAEAEQAAHEFPVPADETEVAEARVAEA